MQAADFHGLIESALAALRDELTQGQIEVVRHFATDLPEHRVDAAKIEQLFMNLFTNALHAMGERGTLTITTRATLLDAADAAFDAGGRGGAALHEGDPVIVIEVADTGAGITPENLGKLFEPFFSTKPTGQGMGLGLTVAKKIVDLHRGIIQLRNREDGRGAIVRLIFRAAS